MALQGPVCCPAVQSREDKWAACPAPAQTCGVSGTGAAGHSLTARAWLSGTTMPCQGLVTVRSGVGGGAYALS